MNDISEAEWKQTPKEMSQAYETELLESEEKIRQLAQAVDPAKLFVAIIANLSIAPAEYINEAIYGSVPAKLELLAYYLFPFFGSTNNETIITPWHTNDCLEILENLFTSRIRARVFSEPDNKINNPVDKIIGDVRLEAEIVRGSAYPEQTADEILGIQGRFESWFTTRLGIGPVRANYLLWAVFQAQQNSVDIFIPEVHKHAIELASRWKEAKKKSRKQRSKADIELLQVFESDKVAGVFGRVEILNKIAPELLPVNLNDLADLEPPPTKQEWEALINLIGLTTTHREVINDSVEIRQRPLFVLPDNRVVLADISNALDVLWNQFEQIAKQDHQFFHGRYQQAKSEWLEDRVKKYFSKIFPEEYIYHKLSYTDPDKGDESVTELDIAIKWGPFLVLTEAKAKQFRIESQLGDVGRLRTDIKQNVEDAFEQAKRAARYISKTPEPVFLEISSGRKLKIDKDGLRRVYLLTVSQHHLAGLATRLAIFQDLGLFQDNEYPLSISIADLETVSEFCDGPDVFLHYIEKRLVTQSKSIEIMADELDLFGAYLDTRLQPDRIWGRDKQDFDFVSLGGWQDQFDEWIMYKRGDLSKPPKIKLNVPDEIQEILTELRKRNDYGARWISFALLDMTDDGLNIIAQGFREIREAELTPGMFRRLVQQDGDTVISIMASLDVPPSLLHERIEARAIVEKYRRKALKSIGFGIMVLDKSKPFAYATWVKGPWEYDEGLEKVIEAEPPFIPAPGEKLPPRNAPCICGSGKKFKKCCLPKIKASKKLLQE